jgi:Bacterial regulatory proteins, tetR family
MKRTRQQAQETRDQILDAAEWVFAEHGVAQTSLEDVAERAGFTRGAIYGHFEISPLVLHPVSGSALDGRLVSSSPA